MAPEPVRDYPIDSVTYRIDGPVSARRTSELAGRFADSLGFSGEESAEIALVVAELASNLVQHASGGVLKLSRIERDGQHGIQIESEDSGPGISDLEQALTDGYSTGGSLGMGLGTVNRLVDDLTAERLAERGVRLVCQRWKRPKGDVFSAPELVFGAVTRSYRRAPDNGDAFIIKRWHRHAIAGVIDGLGHGQFAQRASQTARQYIEQHFDQPLECIFRGAGRACRSTRGVVMALARFDLDRRIVTVASVGNIEVRLIGPERLNLIVRRGVIGLNAPNPVPVEHTWTSTSLLIMHSDGVRTHWSWDEFRNLPDAKPALIAGRLLEAHGTLNDDATIVVIANANIGLPRP